MKINDLAKPVTNKERKYPAAKTQAARVLHIVDLGTQERPPFQGEARTPTRQLWINFELVNDRFEYKGKEVPFRISPQIMTVSNDPKSNCFKLINALDPGDTFKGELDKFANYPCLVTVVHRKVEDKTYANFGGCMPAPDGFPIPETSTRPVVFSYDSPTVEDFLELPEWIQEKLKSAVNYAGSPLERLMPKIVTLKKAHEAATTSETKATATAEEDAPY